MRIALSWLRELVDLPASADGRDVAAHLIGAGFEVDSVEVLGELSGPVVVGQVLAFDEEPQKNGKTIRWCQVRVAPGGEPRGVVCGARNFAAGDLVVVALPGAVLPGGFEISARKTYGHVSDGMICSVRELGIGDDHTGILVLPADSPLGADATEVLGLGDEVLDVAPTPDRGYGMSVRGVARELASAYRVEFRDPADLGLPPIATPGWPVRIADEACDRFVARTVAGIDPTRRTPPWMRRRLEIAGMRSLGLAIDVTNYVMLELGQPLHAYDRARLQGEIVVRRAGQAERLRTLDDVDRRLDPDDLVIADDSGVIGIAGVMGGATTEISGDATDIVVEAAHFAAAVVSRAARRHALLSEASRRFERGVDPQLPPVAAFRAARLLVEFGGATDPGDVRDVGKPPERGVVRMPVRLAADVVGVDYSTGQVLDSLREVGCDVETVGGDAQGGELVVTVPSWRPDLRDPFDLVEEVARLVGYDAIPSVLPVPPASRGLDTARRAQRRIATALAGTGYVETLSYPFMGVADADALRLGGDDPRRRLVRLANPLSDEQPALRTTMLPGLLAALRLNLSRGAADLALFEIGLVFRADDGPLPPPPRPRVDRRPGDDEIAALNAALPRQPRWLGVVLAGQRERSGWWGAGRASCWADAVETVRLVAREAGVAVAFRSDDHAPWHPGRCAAVHAGSVLVGHAGELHPRVLEQLGLPARSCAAEIDLDLLVGAAGEVAPTARLSSYPLATCDVALVVSQDVPAADVEAALRAGAGGLLEDLRLFDVYAGAGVPAGARSLAYRMSLRASDRTLTAEETNGVRDAAVAEAGRRVGAALRG